jgi:sulfur-oxidizing protein SoxX
MRNKVIVLVSLILTAPFAFSDDALEQGKILATERAKGNCLACHSIEGGKLPGNLGPPLLAMKLN